MSTPQEPTDQDLYLAQLNTSDEDIEALLSGGADVDSLIAADVLSDDEPVFQEEEGEEVEIEPSTLTEEEVLSRHNAHQNWLAANGHDYCPMRI